MISENLDKLGMQKTYDEVEEGIARYEEQNLGKNIQSVVLQPDVLSLPFEQLRKKVPEELSEIMFQGHRYCLYVDRLIGQLRGWLKWARIKLDERSAFYLKDMTGNYGFNERPMISRNVPSECIRLNTLIRDIEMKLSRIESVPLNVRNMVACINDIRFNNMRRDKNA